MTSSFPASHASCRVSFPPCCSHAKVARIPFTLIFPDLSLEGQNLSSHSDLFRFSYWDQVLFFLCLQDWEFDWLIGCLVGVILFSFFLGIFDYILFCKGRTIPKKSLSPEIFIYLLCFREVLYLEGRSCALPSSGSLLIYPVFPLRVNSICPFPRVISDFPNFLTSVLLLNLKPKKKLQGCFLTSFSVSITFIKTNIAISLNILKYTHRTTSCHSRHSTAAKYFAFVNLVSQLPAYKSGRTQRLLVRTVSLPVSSGHLLLCFRVTDLTPHIIRRSNPTEK